MKPRKYFYEPGGSGRIDSNGVEWWKCDGLPSEGWFRWDNEILIHLDDHAKNTFWREGIDSEYKESLWTGSWV